MAPFGNIWQCLAPFGTVWPRLPLFGPIWPWLAPVLWCQNLLRSIRFGWHWLDFYRGIPCYIIRFVRGCLPGCRIQIGQKGDIAVPLGSLTLTVNEPARMSPSGPITSLGHILAGLMTLTASEAEKQAVSLRVTLLSSSLAILKRLTAYFSSPLRSLTANFSSLLQRLTACFSAPVT